MSKIEQNRGDDVWQDLVIAILSVNQYSLERTYSAVEGLRTQHMTDPKRLADLEPQEIEERLKAAGCDRGPFMTKLFAIRLASLAVAAEAQGFDACTRVLLSKDQSKISNFLLPINGVGPKVLRNFFLLRGME